MSKKRNRKSEKAVPKSGIWKVQARHFKVIGGAMVVLSFIIQTFLYDMWNEQGDELRAAVLERAVIDKSTLLNEVLYFSVDSAGILLSDSEIREQKIREAARKLAMNTSMTVLYNTTLNAEQKSRLLNSLTTQAASVESYDSYLKFLQFINESFGKYSAEIVLQQQSLEQKRRISRWIYLVTSLLGSCILLLGAWRE